MSWALILATLIDVSTGEAKALKVKKEKEAERIAAAANTVEGGVLASPTSFQFDMKAAQEEVLQKLWQSICDWGNDVLNDAVRYARETTARDTSILRETKDQQEDPSNFFKQRFSQSVWPSLRSRGWKADLSNENDKTIYSFKGSKVCQLGCFCKG